MTRSVRNLRASSPAPPDIMRRVAALARNLWWTWDPDPQRLFAAMDPCRWEASNHNPLRVVAGLSAQRWSELAGDPPFVALLAACEHRLAVYLRTPTWFQRTASARQKRMRIAYFCAEFALHECFPQYAGGLGVLAGDHLKSASDLGVPLVGVGLLYRNGYYGQRFRDDGSTDARYPAYDFTDFPIEDTGHVVRVPLARREVCAKVWRARVGRVPLYLLDTDLPANPPRDRAITARLYGGDADTRIRQEIVLGMGGVRALQAVGEPVTVYHLNEGHAAFCTLERLRQLRRADVAWDDAVARVSATTVFTTHTPVPAGHDRFAPAAMRKYLDFLTSDLAVPREKWLGLGRVHPEDRREPFCMTALALLLSDECNGVSRIHGRVSRAMWKDLYDRRDADTVPIGHITNGVHTATWLSPLMRPLYDRYLKPQWVGGPPDDDCWKRADRIPPAALWRVRSLLRRQLVHLVRQRLLEQIQRRCEPLDELVAAFETFDEDVLTIGFARRFATYKRAPLIFSDPARLAAILNHVERPAQLVFAGKAHPADAAGQAFAQRIYRIARRAGFRGRVVLLEDYDMHVGRILTSGCDVWLNNPLPPQEASGTSGMKPPLHGGLNLSVLDGWWPEAYDGRNGWAIRGGEGAASRLERDRLDAASLYDVIEREVAPLFYRRDRRGIPQGWVRRMIASMRTICGRFNTHRMVAEYLELYS